MISNLFVLSPRGDTILSKIYRANPEVGAHERSHTEAFFRKIKFWDGMTITGLASNGPAFAKKATDSEKSETGSKKNDAPPVFVMPDGLNYLHIKRNGLIFGCSTARNISPCTVIELLSRIAKVFKDYCGTLSEESIRKNFILLYELLDEMVDYGYPQVTRTENLKAFVYNEPIVVSPVVNTGNMVNPKTASANAVHKPVIGSVTVSGKSVNTNQKNEIFVDILERMNVLFSNNGYILNSTVDGCIQMKSYLQGNPELRLALNEELIIGKQSGNPKYGSVVLDDCNFNECVNLSEFEHGRILSFYPPDGEFIVLNYRVTGDIKTPFRVFPSVEETGPKTIEITCLIRNEVPENHFGANVTIELPLPRCTAGATCSMISATNAPGSNAEYVAADKKVLWTMKKFPGSNEQTMRVKVALDKPCTSHIRREIGPINMTFEIPMFNVSNLQVRYLRIAQMPGFTPYRWVRYVTQSNSYVCRV